MKNITEKLINKTAVITGASSGVGLATAEAFAKAGCNLIIAARGEEALQKAAERCESFGVIVKVVPTDMSDYDQVVALVNQARELSGLIDYWINNAGVMASGKFEEIPIEVSHQVVKTNLLGYLNAAHAIIPVFKQQGKGIIINNVSIGGFMPAPYSAVYSATKFGIKGMMECLQGELSSEADIHICNLYPQIQRSTGNMHSAKYSGLDFKVPPTAADPRDTAQALLKLALHPRKNKFPDFSSWFLKTTHDISPDLMVNTASAGMRLMMRLKKGAPTSGNTLSPSANPHRIYGETILPVPSRRTKTALGLAMVALVALTVLGKSK